MQAWTLILLQAAAPEAKTVVDLMAEARKRACTPSSGDEIVVCGSSADADQYRLKPLPRYPGEGSGRAETRLFGNVRGGVETESAQVGGFTSKRVMVKIKAPF